METQDDTPARVLELVREHSGKEYALVDRAKAGEQGAYIIEERSGERFILKFSRTAESTPQGVRQITSRLSAIGYPIPEYVNVGSASGLGWVIQSMLRGTPRPALTPDNIRELVALNELQSGRGVGFETGWPQRPIDGVMSGYKEYCVLKTLREHSQESSAMLARLQDLVRQCSAANFTTSDIVHWDFNPANILIDGGHVSGVVDWEGACAGDRAFDLVTLLFYRYDSEPEREMLWSYIRTNFDLNAIRIYAAHMIIRQVEWSLRKQTQQHADYYTAIAHAMLSDLGC